MKVREVMPRLESDGWQLARTRGSHRHFKHPSKPGMDLPPGALAGILKQAGLK